MSGYIGNIPVPQATQTRQSFTATASQTTFNTAGYSPGYVDVFLNGVKLAPADYTATNGSDVVLAVGAASGDILETVAYEIFQVLDQDFSGDFTVDGSTFVVDSTNDRVGIGTSSPASQLHLEQETSNTTTRSDQVRVVAKSSGTTGVGFGANILFTGERANGTLQAMGRIGFGASTNTSSNLSSDFIVETASSGTPSEAMRIDSSGNLLVGSTDTTPYDNTSGNAIRIGDGLITSAQEGGNAAIFNRMLSDGSIAQFRKDGSTVGSIGAALGQLFIGQSNTGVILQDSNQRFAPSNADGSSNDGNMALGWNNRRWKDLYLSGGVYLGGTGSANKLDDYEEGTWTPNLSGSSYVSGGTKYGFYTKLGNLVTATAVFDNATITGGASTKITGLPFTVSAEGSQTRFPAFSSHAAGSATSGTTIGGGYAEQSTTNLILLQNNSTVTVTLVNGTLFIFITVIYRT